MFGLVHADTSALFYGVVIFLGIFSLVIKIKQGWWLSFFAELFVFILVFKLHGGTMQGGFAATVAALIAGVVFPMMFRGSKS
jgi:hypothetical protein